MSGKKRQLGIDIQILNKYTTIITEESGQMFFEIGNEVTNDIAEAVALLIEKKIDDPTIWDIRIGVNREISPIKSLYWIMGGDKIWGSGKGRIDGWGICGSIFEEEFGDDITYIVKNSVKLSDVRDAFVAKLLILRKDHKKYYKYCG